MIIHGGKNSSGLATASAAYDPATDSWQALTNITPQRYEPTAVWAGSEMIAWGGDDLVQPSNNGFNYNPELNTVILTSSGDAPAPRVHHAAVWDGARMLIFNGRSGSFYFGNSPDHNKAYTPPRNYLLFQKP